MIQTTEPIVYGQRSEKVGVIRIEVRPQEITPIGQKFLVIDWDIANDKEAVFSKVVIYLFEDSESIFKLFVHYIEQCRSAILTLIELEDWSKCEQAKTIVDGLQNASQVQKVKNLIMEL